MAASLQKFQWREAPSKGTPYHLSSSFCTWNRFSDGCTWVAEAINSVNRWQVTCHKHSYKHNPQPKVHHISSGAFADDLIGIAGSINDLHASLKTPSIRELGTPYHLWE